jgi:hypothetical protein
MEIEETDDYKISDEEFLDYLEEFLDYKMSDEEFFDYLEEFYMDEYYEMTP